jgi:hypothetical protein
MIGKVWDLARKGGSSPTCRPRSWRTSRQRGLGVHVDQIFKRGEQADFDDSKQYADLMRMSAEDPAAS